MKRMKWAASSYVIRMIEDVIRTATISFMLFGSGDQESLLKKTANS